MLLRQGRAFLEGFKSFLAFFDIGKLIWQMEVLHLAGLRLAGSCCLLL